MSFEQPITYQILLTKKTPDYCISKENPVSIVKHTTTMCNIRQIASNNRNCGLNCCRYLQFGGQCDFTREKLLQEVAKVKETTDQSVCIRLDVWYFNNLSKDII